LQAGLRHQRGPELPEASGRFGVAELVSGAHAEADVCGARSVAVAVLEAERDRLACGERIEVLVRELCRWREPGQDVERRKRLGVGHRRQFDQLLDGPGAEKRPDALDIPSRLSGGWIRG